MLTYPGAKVVPGTDCGPFVGGPPRGVLHTTEGTSAAGAIGAFRANDDWPHFTVSYENGRFLVIQHLDITRGAKSLEHRPGTVQTNLQHAIQIEIVGAAAHSSTFPAAYLAGIAQLMRWIEQHTGIKPVTSVQWKPYPASGGDSNGIRLSDAAWLSYNGWCGHMHVPNQEHGDPGALNIHALLPTSPTAPTVADAPAPAHPALPLDGDVHFVVSHAEQTTLEQ